MTTSSPVSPSSKGLSFEASQELQQLQHFTTQITRVIPALLRYQTNALTRANALKSATRGLPPEVLSMIFEHACMLTRADLPWGTCPDEIYSSHYLITLAGVSSWWRQIVLSCPQLWSSFLLVFDGMPNEGHLNLLRLYLTRSGTMRLDIKIYFHSTPEFMEESWPDPETLVDPSVDAVIVGSLPRVRSLHLEGASVKWLSYASQLSNLLRLTLSLNHYDRSSDDEDTSTLALFNSPNLYQLSLAVYSSIDLGIDAHWSNITIVALTEVAKSTCLRLLAMCSNIEEYTVKCPYGNFGTGSSWSLPLTLSSLRNFSWEIWDDDDDLEPEELLMFRNIRVPALEKLNMRIHHHGQHPNLHLFCSRLPQSISSIDVQVACDLDEPVNSCIFKSFASTLQIKELKIGCLSMKSAHHALHVMMDPGFFRNVQHLRFYKSNEWMRMTLPIYCGELIVQIIRARVRKKLTEHFRVSIDKILVEWTSEKQGQLAALGTQGWTLDVSP